MNRMISPADFQISAGTWTLAEGSNLISRIRTAAAAAFTSLIHIPLPQNLNMFNGATLQSIDLWYAIGTADCTDFATVELKRMTMPASGANVTIALDSNHDTNIKRRAIHAGHMLTINLPTPVWVQGSDQYWVKLIVDAAATSIFTFFGARANYTLRL